MKPKKKGHLIFSTEKWRNGVSLLRRDYTPKLPHSVDIDYAVKA